jgi:ATP-dependent DNA ligase
MCGMAVLRPPVALVLARDEREVPAADPRWVYEPKFDGWRAMLFTAAGVVQSRRNNDLAARFPEIAVAGRELGDLVLDGELVALREGRLEFGALVSMPRAREAAGVVIYYVVFDVLADGDDDLRRLPLSDRRARLEELLAGARPPLQLTPSTTDRDAALAWMSPELAEIGIEGVVAKDATESYRAGRTGSWLKVRQKVVVDAVVVGVAGSADRPEALLLARPDDLGALVPIGLSLPLPPALRDEAAALVTPTGEPRTRLPGSVMGHQGGEYQPVHATLVVEAEAEATVMSFSGRLRPRIHRLRPDVTVEEISGRPEE